MKFEETQAKEIVLYIGTHKLVALEGSLVKQEPVISRYAMIKNPAGFDKGLVVNLERAAATLEEILSQLFKGGPAEDLACSVVLGHSRLRTHHYSSSQYYQGFQRTITAQDVRQVISQTRSVATLPLTEFVLEAIPQSFIVNDLEGVANPVGLEAQRLGVDLQIYTMNFQEYKNISRAFETAEIEVKGFYPKTLMVSEAVLTDQEKNEGTLVIDIADEATHLVLWKDGEFQDARVCPAGGAQLSAQIAAVWSVDPHDARKLKEQYGSLESKMAFGEEIIPLVERNGGAARQVKRQEFQEKFQDLGRKWLEEILIQADLFAHEHKMLHPHYVFAGGGTALEGFLEFLQKNFSCTGRIGFTRQVEAPHELLVDSSLAGALGMYRWMATREKEQREFLEPRGFFQKTFAHARDWFSTYF